jgi:beta-RFAP synthase
MAIRIETPSRLHFGFLAMEPTRGRRFGGVGLMLEQPGVALVARRSRQNRVYGAVAPAILDRANQLIARLADGNCGLDRMRMDVRLERCPPLHTGLGTGTQLSLALARAIFELNDRPTTINDLAKATGRGQRSGIGLHGFTHGGLIVDGGKRVDGCCAPLIARVEFPVEWPILLVRPAFDVGLHGELEQRVFAESWRDDEHELGALARVVWLGVLPAACERDYQAFGDAVFEYNHRVGERFAAIQGGPYAHAQISQIVAAVRRCGVPAVGQSSWGPTVFIIVQDADRAAWIARRLTQVSELCREQIVSTQADNHGARIVRLTQD